VSEPEYPPPCACPSLAGPCPAHPDIPVHVPLRNTGVLVYDMVLPKWPDGAESWTPLRDILRRSGCYRLASGAKVHVKPGCRC
jgi:hypothetical protein